MDSDVKPEYEHVPALSGEIVEFIEKSIHEGSGILVDATLGEGGHSEILLKKFQYMEIIGLDRDMEILKIAEKRLEPFKGRVTLYNDNFSNIKNRLGEWMGKVNYVLYDFGISSYHLNESKRGFSFASDGPLDMRLDSSEGIDAGHVVNRYDEKKLADIIYKYGEERWAKKIASAIVRYRGEKQVETTGELAGIVLRAIPKRFHVKNIHPATRVFQAIRIEVNSELPAIEKSLGESFDILSPGGRILAMSYHSLEDRIVKTFMRRLERGCGCGMDGKNCFCVRTPLAKVLTKKPVRPAEDEVLSNKRARSARLRVCEKVAAKQIL